jgi:acetolactate synthase-1/2/3 large subunit
VRRSHRLTGRPGPVLIDLPKDVLLSETTWSWPERINLPGYKPTTKGNNRQVSEAVKLILAAKRPVLYVGGGVIKANASRGTDALGHHRQACPWSPR